MATISKYQTASGATLYRVRYRTPDRRQTQKRGFTTKRDAEAFAATVEVTKMRGEYVAPSLGRVTVGRAGAGVAGAASRAHEAERVPVLRERLARARGAAVGRDCGSATFGYTEVQAWVCRAVRVKRGPVDRANRLLGAGAASSTTRCETGCSRRTRRAASSCRSGPKRQNVYLTAEQLDRLADEAGRYRSLVLLLGVGGLRWGEAAALRVSDVDFLRRRIELHRNAVPVGSSSVVGTLKSNKNRTVVLPAFVVDELAAQLRGQGP